MPKRWLEEEKYLNEELTLCSGLNITKIRRIEEFVTGGNAFNDNCNDISKMKLAFIQLPRLKRIEIGNNSFKYIREFVIDGLEQLESVKIGKYCFKIGDEGRTDGTCRIVNCSKLHQLEIGYECFYDFKSLEISNVDSLHSIEFGEECFKYIEEFSLKGKLISEKYLVVISCDLKENDGILDLPSLETVELRDSSFDNCHLAVLESMVK